MEICLCLFININDDIVYYLIDFNHISTSLELFDT